MIKKILVFLLVALVVIQFIRPRENHSTVLTQNDITRKYNVPDSVLGPLKRACYDCHSNNAEYPWYNHIQPVAAWLNYHITGGKRHLNFSNFGSLPLEKQAGRMKGVVEEIQEDGMPLDSYLWMHANARLSQEEKDRIIKWARGIQQELYAQKGLYKK